MEITSNHLDVVARGGYGWREEVDDGEEIARRSENFGHPVGKSAPFHFKLMPSLCAETHVVFRRPFRTTSLNM